MYAVIRIPDFPLQAALRHEPEEKAAALLDENPPKLKISHVTETARAAGVCEGMTPAQALARCPGLRLKTRSESREKAARDALLYCAYAVSPRIEATGEGICTLDMTALRPGASPDIPALLDRLGRLHLRAQAGVAATPLLAFHASRLADPFLVVEDPEKFLDALPIEYAFPASGKNDPKERERIFAILAKWGIGAFGQLAALGADRIAERLGAAGLELFECASSTAIRPLQLILPPETFEEAMDFEREIETLEPLLFVLRRFLEQICLRLEIAWLTAKEIRLRLHFSAGEDYERLFQIPAPTRNVDVLFRMLHTHLENFKSERPITALHLSAAPSKPAGHQLGLFETALRDPNLFYETLARLLSLLGNGRVGTPVAESTWRPDAFHMHPPGMEDSAFPAPVTSASGPALRRFRPPLPASVLLRDDKPAFIATASFNASIRDTRGPWRGSGNWWDAANWVRDEWDIQTETGALYRLSRQSEGWFVEGELG